MKQRKGLLVLVEAPDVHATVQSARHGAQPAQPHEEAARKGALLPRRALASPGRLQALDTVTLISG